MALEMGSNQSFEWGLWSLSGSTHWAQELALPLDFFGVTHHLLSLISGFPLSVHSRVHFPLPQPLPCKVDSPAPLTCDLPEGRTQSFISASSVLAHSRCSLNIC